MKVFVEQFNKKAKDRKAEASLATKLGEARVASEKAVEDMLCSQLLCGYYTPSV